MSSIPATASPIARSMRAVGPAVGIVGTITKVLLAVLLAGLLSGFVALTVAVFVTGPNVDPAVTTSVIVAEAPFASVPREHMPGEQEPCDGV